jgi:hypothetical protein
MVDKEAVMHRLLEWLLRIWSGVLVLSACLWLVPDNWTVWIPGPVRQFLIWQFGPTDGVFTGVRMGAYFTDDTVSRIQDSLPRDMVLSADQANGLGVQNQGDVNIGWSLQFFPTGLQGAAHVALHVLPLLIMAMLWWWLAGAVAQSRHEEVFTLDNARRLLAAGVVIALGAPVVAFSTWLLNRWILATSQFADRAEVPVFGLTAIPWSVVAAGLALIVLGSVWRKGAVKERELAGLV